MCIGNGRFLLMLSYIFGVIGYGIEIFEERIQYSKNLHKTLQQSLHTNLSCDFIKVCTTTI